MSEEHKGINEALLAAQRNISTVIKNERNPHFKSDYATLASVIAAVKTQLNNEGILVTQPVEQHTEGAYCVVTRLTHVPTGQTAESTMPIVAKDMHDPQKWGSAITYARRYPLQSLVLLPAIDDDGNAAATAPAKPRTLDQAAEKIDPEKKQEAIRTEAKKSLWATAQKHGLQDVAELEAYAHGQGIRKPLGEMTSKEMNTLEGKIIIARTGAPNNE